jgi:hypothetical protein
MHSLRLMKSTDKKNNDFGNNQLYIFCLIPTVMYFKTLFTNKITKIDTLFLEK